MATDQQRLTRLETRLALEELNHRFCHCLDHGRYDELLTLFTHDACYQHGTRCSIGRKQIAEVFSNRQAMGDRVARHLQTGLLIRLADEQNATGQSVCLTFAANAQVPVGHTEPYLVADFIDEYQRGGDGMWRISKRSIQRIFVAKNNQGPVGQIPGGEA